LVKLVTGVQTCALPICDRIEFLPSCHRDNGLAADEGLEPVHQFRRWVRGEPDLVQGLMEWSEVSEQWVHQRPREVGRPQFVERSDRKSVEEGKSGVTGW